MSKIEYKRIVAMVNTLIGAVIISCTASITCIVGWNEPELETVIVEPVVIEPAYIHINNVVLAEPEPAPYVPLEPTVEELEAEQWTDSLEYLAMCVEAEAGDQTELGKRLVCDTVLNRFESGKYETLYDVINEEHNGVYQYSVVEDGRILTAEPTEETYRIVAEELVCRTNTEVLYFRTKKYHTFGTPLFKEDDHYFSK